MKILFLTDNFPPETNAPASRTFEHAREWVKNGHEVTVITGAPNFPHGKVYPGYRNKLFQSECVDGIKVIRVLTYIAANKGTIRRTVDYLSFMFSSFVVGLFQRKQDILVGTSPQFFTVCSAYLVSSALRIPFVFELRDFWPASVVTVGAVKNKNVVIRIIEKLEMYLYRSCEHIVAVTNSFKSELIERGIDEKKVSVVLNGADLEKYQKSDASEKFRKKFGLKGKFVVSYLGTHGMAHALEYVVDAAQMLEGEKDIHFFLAGGGAMLEDIQSLVKQRQVTNLTVAGPQPKEDMPGLWGVTDLALITLKDDAVFSQVIPSKIFEAMAMEVPMLIAVPDGEATGIVVDNGVGIAIAPEDSEAMAKEILLLKDNTEKLNACKEAAKKSIKMYDRKEQARKMEQVLREVLVRN